MMKKLPICFLSLSLSCSLFLQAQDNDTLMYQIKRMYEEHDPAKSLVLMNTIIKENKLQAGKDAETIDVMKGDIAIDYLEAGKYTAFEQYIYKMRNKFNQTSYLNMGAATLLKKGKDLNIAEGLAKKTLTLYYSYKDDPVARPSDMPKEDWNRFIKLAYFIYCDTYAEALHAMKKNKEALLYQEKAFNGPVEEGMPESVERYATLLHLNNQDDRAYPLLLKVVSTGKSTNGTNELLKTLYVKKKKDATGFNKFFDSLQVNVIAVLKEEYKKKIQDIEAPGFTLKDLEGRTVSLSDYRGKIVVIDFWATWCFPCKASFPAMSKVMKQHPEVQFLFIATRERQEDAVSRIKNFITHNQYPFYVLMDEPMGGNGQEFKALSSYKPEGIPAKIVIDFRGRQRFISEGFSSETQLINELEAMIQLVKELS